MEGQGHQDQNWMPLESNPEVINEFVQRLGLRTENYSFIEMLSTEEWAIEMIPQPALGVLFLYEETPVQKEHNQAESHLLKPEETPANAFFMKQYARNACGTIALFHIILNAAANHPDLVTPGSYLDTFKTTSTSIDPAARGELFKNSNEIKSCHTQAVHEGQTQAQSECDSHFIAFFELGGFLYEADGMKLTLVNHGPCNPDEVVLKAAAVIKQYMNRDPDNNNFSMIVLAAAAA